MTDDRALFELLCRLLARRARADLEASIDDLSSPQWSRLIHIANLHYAAPILIDYIERRELVAALPDDARGQLVSIRLANAHRNNRIRRQVATFVPDLNDAGIDPILLKGSAFLFDRSGYDTTRMMIDIDLLVPPDTNQTAWDVMHDLGYRAISGDDYSRAHQMNPLRLKGAAATVEIHKTPGPQRELLGVGEVFDQGFGVVAGKGHCRLMASTHRVLHTLFHGQIQDFHYWFARPQLRTLLDIRHLCETSGRIDWEEIYRRLTREGYGEVVEGTAALLEAWLDMPSPPAVPTSARGARYVSRCEARTGAAEREITFWQRWIGWAGINLLPSRLIYRHRLEDEGRLTRIPVLVYRQAAFVVKMAKWPLRHRKGRADIRR